MEYVVTAPNGEKFRITAPEGATEAEVLAYAQANFDKPQAGPADRRSLGAGVASAALQGLTFGTADEIRAGASALLGSEDGWFDYSRPIGQRYDEALERERSRQKEFAERNPVLASVSEIAGGVAGAFVPVVGQLGAPARGVSLAGNLARGAGAGAALGGAYGFGSGEGGFTERVENMGVPMAAGAAAGALSVPLASLVRNVTERTLTRAARRQSGLPPEATDLVRQVVAADTAAGQGAARIASGGPNAMLAEAGTGTLDLLDAASQLPAVRAGVVRAATERGEEGAKVLGEALDRTFGSPEGVLKTARGISRSTAPARQAAYLKAYETPIDYAAETGRNIEGILGRVPKDVLSKAIKEANEAMQVEGLANKQILASIADDGSVSFREMPNVQQLDEIKKALQEIGRQSVDQFGRPTGQGARANKLARDLRDALGKAVPDYDEAVRLGGDKIAMDQALETGQRLHLPTFTREQVREAVKGMNQAERAMVGTGFRSQLDETMANVRGLIDDPNSDANAIREGMTALRRLSSRAMKEKLATVLPSQDAKSFYDDYTKAVRAMELQAKLAVGSRTNIRGVYQEAMNADRDTLIEAARSGSIPRTISRGIQGLTGRTRADIARMKAEDAQALVRLLTETRGPQAVEFAQMLERINQRLPAVQAGADRTVRRLGALPYPAGATAGALQE